VERSTLVREVKEIILRHIKPQRIYLYGSEASGEAQADSDIDIAFDDPSKPDLERMREEIERLPSLIKVDIHNLAECEPRFVNRVKSTGRSIYSATKALRLEDGLHNFGNALERFVSIVDRRAEFDQDGYGDVYLDLAVKRFEFTFEMSWKAMKRGLAFLGLECKSPRGCIQEAFAQGLIHDEAIWLNMIEMRNLSSHNYDEAEIRVLLERMIAYKTAFVALQSKLQAMLPPIPED
jgi:nucleotidyltransferase substrate binding protein (TIGR01987 family)